MCLTPSESLSGLSGVALDVSPVTHYSVAPAALWKKTEMLPACIYISLQGSSSAPLTQHSSKSRLLVGRMAGPAGPTGGTITLLLLSGGDQLHYCSAKTLPSKHQVLIQGCSSFLRLRLDCVSRMLKITEKQSRR